MELLRRLNAYNAELWVKGPNKNRISIAFSIERNSGMAIRRLCSSVWQLDRTDREALI